MEAERTQTKRSAPRFLPFSKSATWASEEEMSERNLNGVLLFIALESLLARRQPSCDDESGPSGDGSSHW